MTSSPGLTFSNKAVISSAAVQEWVSNALWHPVRASIKEGWQAAQTVESNDVFQGVTLPPEARRGRFDFRPLAGYAWIARVFWLFSFLLIVFCFVRTSRCQALERV